MTVAVADVRQVYTTTLDDTALGVHLATAQLIADEQLASCGMSQDRIDKIIVYLAAHFAELSTWSAAGESGPLKSSRLGEATDVYAIPNTADTGYGFASSRWGQMALALDTCGVLRNASGPLPAQFRVV